jgi:hypothetical protein
MLRIGSDIPDRALQYVRIFPEQTERVVAAHTQQAADLTATVIMIHMQ